ncbi:hypothetical protein L7849_010110, partial [Providencia rettgeri]|uniref:hypothetical protein n=1 Tax=Providencia rettgeri TaxID=587 RepID=UPI001EE6B91C
GNAKELESKLNTLKVVYKHIEKLKSAHGYYQSMIYAMKEYIVMVRCFLVQPFDSICKTDSFYLRC